MLILIQNRALKNEARRQLEAVSDIEAGSDPSPIDPKKDPYDRVPGITTKFNEDDTKNYVVSWNSATDPQNPHCWSKARRFKTTVLLILVTFAVTVGSSIDSAIAEPAAQEFHVAPVTEALGGTGIFLIGFGIGALIASPLSELFGRFFVYVGALSIFAIWEMASALAPNIGAQIVFRFLAGLSASAPLTVAGGSMSDI